MKPTPGKIVIFGQYKTGTTGLFTKIRNSLPEAEREPRTLFEPREYRPEAGDDSRWVLAKTILKLVGHSERVKYSSFLGFDRRIYLTRDPRDWLVSSALFLCQEKPSVFGNRKSTGWIQDYLRKKEAEPQRYPLKELLDYIFALPPSTAPEAAAEATRRMQAFCMAFEKGLRDNYLRLRYEDFVDGRLESLSNYMEFDLKGDANVDRQYAHVPRTCTHSDWKNWLTPEDEAFFRPYFEAYIREYGYESDWQSSERPRIDPAHGSRYVERVIQLKRQSHAVTNPKSNRDDR